MRVGPTGSSRCWRPRYRYEDGFGGVNGCLNIAYLDFHAEHVQLQDEPYFTRAHC
jgi:hypothetical protein